MGGNSNLNKAKKAKNDEFYTRYEDIEKELVHYKDELFGKTIYCPCDDYRVSEFPKFFKDKFEEYGLKKVISTNYDLGNGAWCWTYDGQEETINELQGDGDYNSPECSSLRDSADLVCTNPPFSKFRDFFKWLDKDKKFIILGNINAIAYKEVFPLIKDNKLWLGASIHSGDRKFYVPDSYSLSAATCGTETVDGVERKYINVKGVRWFTNIDHKQRHDKLDLCKKYNSTDYPKYDNYDAINVNKVSDIPEDYFGVMGVPITFLDKYCPSQFNIVGLMSGGKARPYLNGKSTYNRIFIKRK